MSQISQKNKWSVCLQLIAIVTKKLEAEIYR